MSWHRDKQEGSVRPPLTLADLKASARTFSGFLSASPTPNLYGVTDGKAVGTYVEGAFNTYIADRFEYARGNAARGIDFPDLQVDLKVTSVIQPQSSCPFADAKQKVYGLGYHLLVFVYAKTDSAADAMATLDIQHTLFINAAFTADRQTTTGLAEILRRGGNVDDIDAFLEERSLPLDEIGRRSLAQQILSEPPRIGHLTISNALQWRLQYGHAIQSAAPSSSEVEDLRG